MLDNYYIILGIPPTATTEEIKKAFRLKAKIFHPDVNKSFNAKLKFQLLNEAYQILSDTEKRKAYDYKWKTRYGASFHNRHKTPEYKQPSNNGNYYKAYTSYKKYEAKIEKTFVDDFLFYFLIIIGVFSVIMGVLHLIYKEWRGIDSLSQLVLGLWLLYLLLSGWRYIAKD
ncbi:MAG: Chaperone protein DnaJ [Bacteroidetes bacterium ADurb.Bin408]|nr:MAG: Chaperone protein DnaJ [Bacteroidetes bacterium ADurb.Bin408]